MLKNIIASFPVKSNLTIADLFYQHCNNYENREQQHEKSCSEMDKLYRQVQITNIMENLSCELQSMMPNEKTK